MEDLKDAEVFSKFDPLQYIFTFCLTRDIEENISIWKMYSNLETGVRIEFNKDTIFAPIPKPTYIPISQDVIEYPQYTLSHFSPWI